MQSLAYTTQRPYRAAFALTFCAGMALCTAGIRHTTTSGWLHPASLLGITLGLAALGLGGAVLLRRAIGPVRDDRAALLALLALIVLKFSVGLLYPALP